MKKQFNKDAIDEIPNNKPVVYTIKTTAGNPNYIGIAKRGQANQRPLDHIGKIPGATLEVKQYSTITEARAAEERAIKKHKPKYNKVHNN